MNEVRPFDDEFCDYKWCDYKEAYIYMRTGEYVIINQDPLYRDAVKAVKKSGDASVSFVQKTFSIGLRRAVRIITRMEIDGFISKPDRLGNRKVNSESLAV